MRLLPCSILAAALTGAVAISQANAAGSDNMAPGGMQLQSANPAAQPKAGSAPRGKKKATTARKKAPVKKSDSSVIDGYRQAYDLIYKQQNYAEAIVALRALNRDDHPDVANLIGFSSRKLGRTEDARDWYEKALAADPNHTRTWQYYGMWHLERGDRAKAEEHLTTIAALCGTTCEDYASLRNALDGDMTY
jgi:Flp pilus assembly protein TadD